MKKRLISMLLTVLMVASLFGGMSVSAYADEEYATQEYTLKSGDTLLKVCNKLGLNWYSCQTAINKLNNISEAQYRKLSVGQVITLPATNEEAVKIAKATISSGSSTGGTVISGGTGSSTGSVSGVNAAYWLIPYTMQKGETVAGVCNVLGISFATYSEQIKTINNISSWSKVAAGKTLLLPSASAPAAGTSCYAVAAHQIQKGETTYSICNQYGISYNANASLMQTLNKGTSLTNIKYGRTLYVPVATVTGSSSIGTGSTGSGSTGSGSTGSGSSSSGSGSSTTKTYKLSTGTVKNGKISFTVNGKTVTSAAAGSTVTIVASPDSMCGLKSVSLKYADGSAVPKVTDSTFTMPECDVVVNAEFAKGYYMGVIFKDGKGSAELYNENGVATTTAAKGAKITVKASANAGYAIEKIYVVKNDSSKAIVQDNMKSGDSFTMPDSRVFVYVQCRETATYKLEKAISGSSLNGSFVLKVNGSEVTRAAAGATVEVVCSPASGYSAPDEKITIHNNAYGTDTHPTNGKFIMPAADVKVTVEFTKGAAEKYAIETKDDVNGYGTVTADVKEARAGTTVTLTPWAKAGYEIEKYVIEGSYGKETITASGSTDTFTMPASAVTVTPVFKAISITYNGCSEIGGNGTVTLKANGETLKKGGTVSFGTTVSVDVKAPTGYEVESIKVNDTKVSETSFTVPNASFSVEISYKVKSYTLTVENNWIGFFDLEIDDVKKEVTAADQQIAVKYGSSVKIVLKDSSAYTLLGYTLDGETKTGDNFNMPAANAKITVLIEAIAKAAPLTLEEPEVVAEEPLALPLGE